MNKEKSLVVLDATWPLRTYCVIFKNDATVTVKAHQMQDPFTSISSLGVMAWRSFITYRPADGYDIVAKFREANVKSVRIVDEEPI